MSLNTPAYLSLWAEALGSPLGIFLRTSDPLKLKESLYRARKVSADPDLDSLAIRTSPLNPKGELWIIKLPKTEP